MILRGIGQGVPTAHLAKELKVDESHLRTLRHEIQQEVESLRPKAKLRDAVVEADELYQNAGEKGKKHDQADNPPRRRANKIRGRDTKRLTVNSNKYHHSAISQ